MGNVLIYVQVEKLIIAHNHAMKVVMVMSASAIKIALAIAQVAVEKIHPMKRLQIMIAIVQKIVIAMIIVIVIAIQQKKCLLQKNLKIIGVAKENVRMIATKNIL